MGGERVRRGRPGGPPKVLGRYRVQPWEPLLTLKFALGPVEGRS